MIKSNILGLVYGSDTVYWERRSHSCRTRGGFAETRAGRLFLAGDCQTETRKAVPVRKPHGWDLQCRASGDLDVSVRQSPSQELEIPVAQSLSNPSTLVLKGVPPLLHCVRPINQPVLLPIICVHISFPIRLSKRLWLSLLLLS